MDSMKDEAWITPAQGFDLTAWVAADLQARLDKDFETKQDAAGQDTTNSTTATTATGVTMGNTNPHSDSSSTTSNNIDDISAENVGKVGLIGDMAEEDNVSHNSRAESGISSGGSSSADPNMQAQTAQAGGRRLTQVSFTAPNQSATIQRLPTAFVLRFGNTFDLLGTGNSRFWHIILHSTCIPSSGIF